MGCGQQRGEGREEKWVREGRKEAFSLWSCSCINTNIFPGPTKPCVVWAPPHFSHMVHSASFSFWAPERVGFLQSHFGAFVHAVPSTWNNSPPSLSLFSFLLSFILKHCFLKEAFTDLGHVKIPTGHCHSSVSFYPNSHHKCNSIAISVILRSASPLKGTGMDLFFLTVYLQCLNTVPAIVSVL